MVKKTLALISIVGSLYTTDAFSKTEVDQIPSPMRDSPHMDVALNRTFVFPIENIEKLTAYSPDPKRRKKALETWALFVSLNSLNPQHAFQKLVESLRYLYNNHHVLYQEEYYDGVFVQQDMENFLEEQLQIAGVTKEMLEREELQRRVM
jgi:hypothetical protein